MTDTLSTVSLDPVAGGAPRVGRRLSTAERDVGALVAGLIDGQLERRAPLGFHGWVARELGYAANELGSHVEIVNGLDLVSLAFVLRRAIAQHGLTDLRSASGEGHAVWSAVDVGDDTIDVPVSLRVLFPAGTVGEVPLGVCVEPGGTDGTWVTTTSAPGCEPRARQLLSREMRAAAADPAHPYRGVAFEVSRATLTELEVRAVAVPATDRADLCLPDAVWAEVDDSIHGLLDCQEMLADLDLGRNRGLLLTGPPGTGKTHLARVVANEVRGRAAVLFPTSDVVRRSLPDLYDLAASLAPAVVVLEDVDLIVGSRENYAGDSLVDFLVAVDGAMTEHEGIITIATTNDPGAIDPAAKREARLDRIIELPLPDAAGREQIWARYTSRLPEAFDLDRLAERSAGMSGAAIREVVRAAVLKRRAAPDMTALLEALAAGRGEETVGGGTYL